MNLAAVDQIAKAVLYEGYMLYPYRPSSVKNQQRWNFGVLCPQAYSEAQSGSDNWTMQTECLVVGGSDTSLDVRVRFLQLVARTLTKASLPETNSEDCRPEQSEGSATAGEEQSFHAVERLEVDGHLYQPWQEAVEREVSVPVQNLQVLTQAPFSLPFLFAASTQQEYLRGADGAIAGAITREQSALHGIVEVASEKVDSAFYKITVRIRNLTPFAARACSATREDALLSSLVSTHTILGVESGRFCSLLDPPESIREIVATLQNTGTWPVLVGKEGEADTLLSSPIILYDYPQIAPESAGDLFDGTEIDEILSLRIMTLTDEEKQEMRSSDDRARQMLERTETMPAEQFMKLHGVLRNLHPILPQDQERGSVEPSAFEEEAR